MTMKTRVDLAPAMPLARPAATSTVICTHVTLTRSPTRVMVAASRAATSTRRTEVKMVKVGMAVVLAVVALLLLSLASGVPITELFDAR